MAPKACKPVQATTSLPDPQSPSRGLKNGLAGAILLTHPCAAGTSTGPAAEPAPPNLFRGAGTVYFCHRLPFRCSGASAAVPSLAHSASPRQVSTSKVNGDYVVALSRSQMRQAVAKAKAAAPRPFRA